MPSLFLITSAINTKFGVFDASTRLNQTLETISSIRVFVPDAKLVILEMGAISLNSEQSQVIKNHVDLLEFHNDNYVQTVYQDHRWSIVKNLTEMKCFQLALIQLKKTLIFEDINRLYKISGRYVLNQNFNPILHASSNKICVSGKRPSCFQPDFTGVPFSYMSRLWSWPSQLTPIIQDAYFKGLAYANQQIDKGLYCDIEHMLYKFLPEEFVIILEPIGVEGKLGPNGLLVKD